MRRTLVLLTIAALLFSLAPLSTTVLADGNEAPIRLKAATFRPGVGEKPDIPPGLTVAAAQAGVNGYYLVQFSGPIQSAWKETLADLGAEVIKIEAPDGDPMRRWGVCVDDSSLWWPIISRNKRSVVADLKDPDDLAFVQRLADDCDVVLENFRPGVLAKFGLDYETLSATNPGVIVTHVSGFGQSGPRATEAGFGSIGEAVGGIRHTTGDPDRPPARCGISLGDSLAAVNHR